MRSAIEMSTRSVDEDLERMRNMSPADRMIYCIRMVEQLGDLPIEHFRELTETVFRLAASNFHRDAYLGITQIKQGQNAIVRNLLDTVIGSNRFTILDVGASDGWFLDRVIDHPSVERVIAFEPNPLMETGLNKRATLHSHLTIVSKAVGCVAGYVELNVCNSVAGLSSLLELADDYHFLGDWFDANDQTQVEVEAITIDDFLKAFETESPSQNLAIKIDVQGFEAQVLQGADATLKSGRVKAILIELVTLKKYRNSTTFLPLVESLTELGFSIYDIHPFYRERHMVFQETHTGRLTEMDCLLVHNDYLKSIIQPTFCGDGYKKPTC